MQKQKGKKEGKKEVRKGKKKYEKYLWSCGLYSEIKVVLYLASQREKSFKLFTDEIPIQVVYASVNNFFFNINLNLEISIISWTLGQKDSKNKMTN